MLFDEHHLSEVSFRVSNASMTKPRPKPIPSDGAGSLGIKMEANQDTLWGSWSLSGNTFAQSQNASHKMKEQRRQKAQHKMNHS